MGRPLSRLLGVPVDVEAKGVPGMAGTSSSKSPGKETCRCADGDLLKVSLERTSLPGLGGGVMVRGFLVVATSCGLSVGNLRC